MVVILKSGALQVLECPYWLIPGSMTPRTSPICDLREPMFARRLLCFMKLDPEDDDYLVYLDSLTLEELIDFDNGTNVDVIVAIGKKLVRQRKFQEAQSYFLCAIDLDPSSLWPHMFLGNLFYVWGKYARAISHFEAAASVSSGIACPYWCLGDVYAAILKDELATEMYMKAVSVDPEDELAQQKLRDWNARLRSWNARMRGQK